VTPANGSKLAYEALQLLASSNGSHIIQPIGRTSFTEPRKILAYVLARPLSTQSTQQIFIKATFQDDDDMNKRSAPGGTSVVSPPKKRKTDNVQKYYAVQAGFQPGVYMTYAECSAQTAGFKGAVCE
jgi:hypothetical protein